MAGRDAAGSEERADPATGTQGHPPASCHGQRYESAYPFGAVCAACRTGAAIETPRADTVAMQLHLEEISRAVAPGAHADLLMGRAGWLIAGALDMPGNLTLFRRRLYGVYNFYNSDLKLLFFFEF